MEFVEPKVDPELLILHNELLVFAMMISLVPAWAGEGSKAVYIPHECSKIPHNLEFVTNFILKFELEFSAFVHKIYCYNVKCFNSVFHASIFVIFLCQWNVFQESFKIMQWQILWAI